MRTFSFLLAATICSLLLCSTAQAQCVEGNCINGSGTKITRGHKYQGDFKENHRHGRGYYTFPSGDKYEGEFVKGLMEGYGVYYYSNGDTYSGDFVAGIPHGVGEYSYADGTSISGVFENGLLVRPDEEIVSQDLNDDHAPSGLPSTAGAKTWDTEDDNISVDSILDSL